MFDWKKMLLRSQPPVKAEARGNGLVPPRMRSGETLNFAAMGYTIPVEFRVDWAYLYYAVYPLGVRYNPKDRLLAPCLQLLLQHESEPSSVVRVLFEGLVAYHDLAIPTSSRLELRVSFRPGDGYEGDYYIEVDGGGGMVANLFTWQQLRAVEQP